MNTIWRRCGRFCNSGADYKRRDLQRRREQTMVWLVSPSPPSLSPFLLYPYLTSFSLPLLCFLPSLPYSPFFSFLFFSSFPLSLLLSPPLHLSSSSRSRSPLFQLGVGERCKLPAGSGAEPQPKSILMHFALKSDIWW